MMRATPLGCKERALQVNAENACHAVGTGIAYGGDRQLLLFAGIAEQGGQQRGGAAAAVGGQHALEGCDRGCVVEQQIAAAVDLQVDEAGRERAACQ